MEELNTVLYEPITTDSSNITGDDPAPSVKVLATSYLMFKIGSAINKGFFPILVPIGAVGNVLSFLVMIQKHNRQMSFSLYISVLSVADTITLSIALFRYINAGHDIDMPPNQLWYCRLTTIVLLTSTMISVFLITMMTFDRFYSIIRPHKAASFNTMKRAKITIISTITFGIVYNIPHVLITKINERNCVLYGATLTKPYSQFYFWFTATVQFLIPYTLLLIWNGIIIHTLRKRSSLFQSDEGQGRDQGLSQGQMKSSERQIIIMLLLVTFGFITLTTPVNVLVFYVNVFEYGTTPKGYAGYYLFYNVGQKLYYMNYGINFFFYVMSGQKFRTDLVNLFKTKKKRPYEITTSNATSITST